MLLSQLPAQRLRPLRVEVHGKWPAVERKCLPHKRDRLLAPVRPAARLRQKFLEALYIKLELASRVQDVASGVLGNDFRVKRFP